MEANEQDTLNYQFYLNRAESQCVVKETYTNSEAVFNHVNGIASQTILPRIFSIVRMIRFEVYGNPSERLQKTLTSFSPHTLTICLLGSVADNLGFIFRL